MADYTKVKPMPPSWLRRWGTLLREVGDRRPLTPPTPEEHQRFLEENGLGEDLFPANRTPAEAEADSRSDNPLIQDPIQMEPLKPGWQTTEFWTHVAMTYVVLPLLGFFANQAISPLGDILAALASSNAILAAVVVALKPALFAALAWAMAQLQKNYTAQRSAVKISHHNLRIAQLKAA